MDVGGSLLRRPLQLHARIVAPRQPHAAGEGDGLERFTLTLQRDHAAVEAPLPHLRTDGLGQRSDQRGAGRSTVGSLDEHIDDRIIGRGICLALRRTVQHEAGGIVSGMQNLAENPLQRRLDRTIGRYEYRKDWRW